MPTARRVRHDRRDRRDRHGAAVRVVHHAASLATGMHRPVRGMHARRRLRNRRRAAMIITPDGFRDRVGRREFVGLAVGAFVVASIPLSRRRPPALVRRSVPVMGTIAQFAVVHPDQWRAHAAIDAAVDELRWVERTMTRFTTTSDVGRANAAAARDAVPVSSQTALVTTEALRWADALDGRYDPALGALVALWDVRNRHEPPAEERIAPL